MYVCMYVYIYIIYDARAAALAGGPTRRGGSPGKQYIYLYIYIDMFIYVFICMYACIYVCIYII